jgi:hypothetical protein
LGAGSERQSAGPATACQLLLTAEVLLIRQLALSGCLFVAAAAASAQEPSPVHIADLDDEIAASPGQRRMQPAVGIWVHDAEHRPAYNIIVRASWSGGVTGTTRCTTDQQGYCQMLGREIDNEQGIMITMTVRAFDNPGLEFDKKLNHEPDGDSDGTKIRIQR